MPDTRIRVAQFSVAKVRAGAEEVALEMARGLDPARFKSYMVCPAELHDQFGDALPAHVERVALTFDSPLHIGSALDFVRLLRRERIDVLHAHMIRAAASAIPYARLAGVPCIVHTCHGREAWREQGKQSSYWFDRRLADWSSLTVAVSHATREWLINSKKLRPQDVVVITNGRDAKPARSEQELLQLRASLGLAADAPVIAVIGRLEEQKGHTYLIDAAPRVLKEHPRAKILFVGEGVLRASHEAQVASRGLTDAIHFLGYRSDCIDLMNMADVIALPSLYEGMPLVLIEAAALGKPVVATAVDGSTEVVVDGTTGLLAAPRDAAAFADALCRVLANPELRKRLGANAKLRAQRELSLERQIEVTSGWYEKLLGRQQPLAAGQGA